MRIAVLLTTVPIGLWLSACSDPAPPAIVDEETIRWQVSSPTLSFKPHFPAEDEDFKVTCSTSGQTLDFTIRAPETDERPAGTLSLRRGKPNASTCLVEVTDAPSLNDSKFELVDNCSASKQGGGCVLTGAFDQDGWDFNGTLKCTNLAQRSGGSVFSLVASVSNNNPVVIKLDNCD